ncbi:MAG: ribonuclease E/G [Elusimicrobiota bacterium]|nr:ribonuclease E/G [Elusimicrobiota bacterium]
MRLRNIAGQVLVDPIPTSGKGSEKVFIEALRHAVAVDPTPTHVHGTTHLGLVEITRERRAAPLAETRLEPFRASLAPRTVALDALRAALTQARASKSPILTITASPRVSDALRGPLAGAVKQAEAVLGGRLAVKKDEKLAAESYHVEEGKA